MKRAQIIIVQLVKKIIILLDRKAFDEYTNRKTDNWK
jgi:hypothetical protein